MGIQMLTYADQEYFKDCLRDQYSLWLPVTIKRCVAITRNTDYPDEPPTLNYDLINIIADIREASLQEMVHSSGMLVLGDNVIWCEAQLRGPRDIATERDDPEAIADKLLSNAQEMLNGTKG